MWLDRIIITEIELIAFINLALVSLQRKMREFQ